MYEIDFFRDKLGNKPTKLAVMKSFGLLFNGDFSRYDNDLKQNKNRSTDSYIKIFKDLEEAAKQYQQRES